MRRIDADDFIRGLKDLYQRAGWDRREVHFSLDDIISNLDNMPTIVKLPFPTSAATVNYLLQRGWYEMHGDEEAKDWWMPTSEALPIDGMECLVTFEDGREAILIYEKAKNENRWSFFYKKVIAWMPLPKPYKRKEE